MPVRFARRVFPANRAICRTAIIAIGSLALTLTACSRQPENGAASAAGQAGKEAQKAVDTPTAESMLAKAASKGDMARIRTLLDEGGNVNVIDALGRTPLHMAAFYGRPKTSALLIASGANINAKDRVGMTPLHAAVLAGGLQEVELLLDKNAEIATATDTGLTPLHLSAATGQPQIAALLIQRGADPQSRDRDGKTPLAYASTNQHQKTIALLKQFASQGVNPGTVGTAP